MGTYEFEDGFLVTFSLYCMVVVLVRNFSRCLKKMPLAGGERWSPLGSAEAYAEGSTKFESSGRSRFLSRRRRTGYALAMQKKKARVDPNAMVNLEGF